MHKIGPLSIDMVVACKIYELHNLTNSPPLFSDIEHGLLMNFNISHDAIVKSLESLLNWGVVMTEYNKNGRIYYISGEARDMVRETYELCWDRVKKT